MLGGGAPVRRAGRPPCAGGGGCTGCAGGVVRRSGEATQATMCSRQSGEAGRPSCGGAVRQLGEAGQAIMCIIRINYHSS